MANSKPQSISELIKQQTALNEKRKAMAHAKRASHGTRGPASDITVYHYVGKEGNLSGGIRIVLHKGADAKMKVGDVQEIQAHHNFTTEYAKAVINALKANYKDLTIHHALQANKECRAAYVKKYNTTKVTNW